MALEAKMAARRAKTEVESGFDSQTTAIGELQAKAEREGKLISITELIFYLLEWVRGWLFR